MKCYKKICYHSLCCSQRKIPKMIPSSKTYWHKPEQIKRTWHLLDAKNKVLGRLATKAAHLLQGKGKRTYSHQHDGGDFVLVINARNVVLTGNKLVQKMDFRHSGYPGGITLTPYSRLMSERPERAVELAVTGMLPKNKLRKRMMSRLRVYPGSEHPHAAQLASQIMAEAPKS
jgi:large subunit ribosomal protein L13